MQVSERVKPGSAPATATFSTDIMDNSSSLCIVQLLYNAKHMLQASLNVVVDCSVPSLTFPTLKSPPKERKSSSVFNFLSALSLTPRGQEESAQHKVLPTILADLIKFRQTLHQCLLHQMIMPCQHIRPVGHVCTPLAISPAFTPSRSRLPIYCLTVCINGLQQADNIMRSFCLST